MIIGADLITVGVTTTDDGSTIRVLRTHTGDGFAITAVVVGMNSVDRVVTTLRSTVVVVSGADAKCRTDFE